MPKELRFLFICVVCFAAAYRIADKRGAPIDAVALFLAGVAAGVSLMSE